MPRTAILFRFLIGCAFFLVAAGENSFASSRKAVVRKASARVQTVKLYGERYIPLEKWGHSKGFSFRWDKPDKMAQLKTRWAELSFNVNSKKAGLNGISIWLSSAIAQSGGDLYIAERDIEKLISPILYPEKMPGGKKIRTIAVAAGHGGKDPGYQINQRQEKKYTLLMAAALKDALQAAGFKVIMTRETDVFIDLDSQAAKANRARADLFITVHYNAASEVDARGVETYCLTPAGAISTNGGSPSPRSRGNSTDTLNALLAFQVHKSLMQNAGLADRGLRRAGFLVLREITMPGVYIEGGFLSNPSDASKITSAAHRKITARAVVDGVLSFKRLVERK